jgi:hypothetical protein
VSPLGMRGNLPVAPLITPKHSREAAEALGELAAVHEGMAEVAGHKPAQ